MLCPVCKTNLSLAERQGVEIDYCPTCRGVWLDRGELDKLIALAPHGGNEHYKDRGRDDDSDGVRRDELYGGFSGKIVKPFDNRQGSHHYPRKRESLWSKLFDFD